MLNPVVSKCEETLFFSEIGILNVMGVNLFREIFHIISNNDRTSTSMTFVMDVSGSMADDIEAATKAAINIVTSTSILNRPADYVLVTFNDPVAWKTTAITTDGDEMVTWLQGLTVRSNYDCPEYSMDGLISG